MFRVERGRSAFLSAFMTLLMLLTSAGVALADPIDDTGTPPEDTVDNHSLPCSQPVEFNRHAFPNQPVIDNQWSPFVPGTQFILEGRANRGGGPLPHRVVLTVTDLTKVINGVRTVVSWDRDYGEAGLAPDAPDVEDPETLFSPLKLQESELTFNAQDEDGNVWNLGEYPEEYENGHLIGAPNTWIPGVQGAKAGLLMRAHPRTKTTRYVQGYSPRIDFLDCAKVFQTHQRVCVPANCYSDVLVTDENSPLAPEDGHQRKFYAAGVGNVQITAVNDPEGETLVLVKINHLGTRALATIHRKALELDNRGYQISAVYRHTEHAR